MVKRGYYFGYALLVFFFLLAFIPMLALSYFNQPSPADDYCYIDTVQKYGFWGAQSLYYNWWSGRYFAYFLAHANPLLYHFPAGFKLYSGLLILFFLASTYRVGQMLLGPGNRPMVVVGFTMAIFGLYVFYMPSIAEGFFWMITSLTNTLPILLLFWLPSFLPIRPVDDTSFSISKLLIACLLIFIIVGCSEIALLVTGIFLAFVLVYLFLSRQRILPHWLIILLVYVLSAYLIISAPGNKVRMEGNEMSGEILPSLYGAFVLTFMNVAKWIVKTPLLIVTVFFWVAVLRSKSLRVTAFRFPLLNLIVTWLVFFGILAACFFPTFYGGLARLGELDPPERNFNSVYLLFLSGWFYCIRLTARFFGEHLKIPTSILPWIGIVSAAVMLLYVYKSPNFKPIFRDLRNGTAYRYDQQIRERYQIIATTSSDTVRVAPLRDFPATLYIDDIRAESEHLWNRCYSGYFGKTVILDPLEPSTPSTP